MKRIAALLLSVLMMTGIAAAEIAWPAPAHEGQRQLQSYTATVNEALLTRNGGEIDMVYELYSTFASLGMDGADVPDTVEMYFILGDTGIQSLQLRVADPGRFATIAAACLWAASPTGAALEQAELVTNRYARIAVSDPATSFEESVDTLQGYQPRAYFAYYANQFSDGRNWMQMTLIFPRPGSADAAFVVPTTPAPTEETDPEANEYEGYFSEDSYNHLEIFVTPTPEPDSAAME